jgi:uncharacterized protein (DUF1697 family)
VAEPTTLHAFVLDAVPVREAVEALAARTTGRERIVIVGKVLYTHTPDGFGKSKLPPVIDRTLKVVSTARNWNTVLKLLEMVEAV